MTFAIVIMTTDRSPRPNTLAASVASLRDAGVFDSPRLANFSVVNADAESLQYVYDAFNDVDYGVRIATGMRGPTANAAFALRLGARLSEKSGLHERPWVLLLSDDVVVEPNFLELAAAWVGHDNDRVVSLTGAVRTLDAFCGSRALALNALDARSLGFYLEERGGRPTYDSLIVEWAREKNITSFTSPEPPLAACIVNRLAVGQDA